MLSRGGEGEGKEGTDGPWDLLSSQSSLFCELQTNTSSCLKMDIQDLHTHGERESSRAWISMSSPAVLWLLLCHSNLQGPLGNRASPGAGFLSLEVCLSDFLYTWVTNRLSQLTSVRKYQLCRPRPSPPKLGFQGKAEDTKQLKWTPSLKRGKAHRLPVC